MKRPIHVRVPHEAHEELRALAAELGLSVPDAYAEAVRVWASEKRGEEAWMDEIERRLRAVERATGL